MNAIKITINGEINWRIATSAPLVLDVPFGPGRVVNPLAIHQRTHHDHRQPNQYQNSHQINEGFIYFTSNELVITLEEETYEDYLNNKLDDLQLQVAAFLSWVRDTAFLYRIGPSAGLVVVEKFDELVENLALLSVCKENSNTAYIRSDYIINCIDEISAKTAAQNAMNGTVVPIHNIFLVDAFAAYDRKDYRQCFLYAAIAAESLAGGSLDQEFTERLAGEKGPMLRFVEITLAGGVKVKKDPIYEALCSKTDFSSLLHERPLYLFGKSLQLELPETYRYAKRLYNTRNKIVHQGNISATEPEKLFALSSKDSSKALQCVSEIFEWFGEKKPVFPNYKVIPALCVSWNPPVTGV